MKVRVIAGVDRFTLEDGIQAVLDDNDGNEIISVTQSQSPYPDPQNEGHHTMIYVTIIYRTKP